MRFYVDKLDRKLHIKNNSNNVCVRRRKKKKERKKEWMNEWMNEW